MKRVGLVFLGHTVVCGMVMPTALWSVCSDHLHERPSTEPGCTSTSTARHSDTGGSELLSRHVTFLAGVVSLDSVAAGGQRTAPATHVVASTVQLVLDTVLRRLQCCHDDDADVMSHSTAVYAVDIVARVCDVTDAAVCDVVQRFVRNVVDNVMNNQLLKQVRHSLITRITVPSDVGRVQRGRCLA